MRRKTILIVLLLCLSVYVAVVAGQSQNDNRPTDSNGGTSSMQSFFSNLYLAVFILFLVGLCAFAAVNLSDPYNYIE